MAHFENITLEKGMYSVPGKSFTQWTPSSGS